MDMKHSKIFNETNSGSYVPVWYPVNVPVKPQDDEQYLVTISDRNRTRVVAIGSYNFDPFSRKFVWSHGGNMTAFSHMPRPYEL